MQNLPSYKRLTHESSTQYVTQEQRGTANGRTGAVAAGGGVQSIDALAIARQIDAVCALSPLALAFS